LTKTASDFSTGVVDSDGSWPNPPSTWSYSSLREASECPRRWMLSRANYPDIWDHWGYPPRSSMPALIGDVVHGSLEVLLRSFKKHGCTSLADPATVAAIKDLGGYTKLVEQRIEDELEKLADNPRAADRIGALRTALRVKVPELRQRVQTTIARTRFTATQSHESSGGTPGTRGELSPGFHPETELRASELRMAGRADLVTVEEDACEIADYKTGNPDPHHADQLRLYALLWNRDHELNPRTLPVSRLVVSYPSHDEDIDPPSATELDDLAAENTELIQQAEASLKQHPPVACPEATICRMCGVRQLCSEYWTALGGELGDALNELDPEWFDVEGQVRSQNGPRSWLISSENQTSLLLRTSSEVVPFQVGDRIRLLNLRREIDPESAHLIGSMTQVSEVFRMNDLT